MKKLLIIKTIHTLIWIFFNIVLGYLFYAVWIDRIDQWVWIGLGLFLLESIILVIFRMKCPLTVMARKYSASPKANFDIFLPEWIARNNKLIYAILLSIVAGLLVYRLSY